MNVYNVAANRMFAIVVSVVFHVVLVTALLCCNTAQEKTPSAPEPAKPVPAAANAVAEPVPQPPREPAATPVKEPAKEPVATPVKAPVATPADVKPAKADPPPAAETVEYVVCAGDTLSKIAKRSSCTVSELAKLNGKSIKALSRLKVGQKIRVKRP